MLTLRFNGGRAALQLRPPLRHASVEIVLPLDHRLLVAEDLFCGQPLVLRQRDKAEVQVRRFLVHVYHSRNDVFLAYTLL